MVRLAPPPIPTWLDAELPFERYSVMVHGRRMHVMEQGEGRTVLCLHGNPTWGFLWRKVARALRKEPLRIVMPDLVGLGLSDKPDDPAAHTIENHAAWVADLLEILDLRDVVFAGQDWGGPIGLLALRATKRMGAMVLMNTVASPPKPGFKSTAFHRFARMPILSTLAFKGLGFPQLYLGSVQGDPKSVQGKVGRAYRWPLAKMKDRVAPLALARMVPDSLNHPSVPALQSIHDFVEGFEGPSALVWGERDPILGRVISHMERMLPKASVTRTQAGHFLQEEVPDEIADAIRKVAFQ
jgi:haloalkane dehalogenase